MSSIIDRSLLDGFRDRALEQSLVVLKNDDGVEDVSGKLKMLVPQSKGK